MKLLTFHSKIKPRFFKVLQVYLLSSKVTVLKWPGIIISVNYMSFIDLKCQCVLRCHFLTSEHLQALMVNVSLALLL